MKNPILYFLLLVLEIPFNLGLNIGYKQDKFFKTLSKKNLEFVLSKKGNFITLTLGYILLLVEINFILEKQSCKRNMLRLCNTGYVKIVFIILTEVIVLYIKTTII